MLLRPRSLRPGATIAVVAPAGPAREERAQAGLALLRDAGYSVRFVEPAAGPRPYLAGTDEARASSVADAIADPTVDAIWCLRGGFGTVRTLQHLDLEALCATPKLLIGFSDITGLLLNALRAGVVTVHGPVVTQLPDLDPASLSHLFELLEGRCSGIPLDADRRIIRAGIAEGPLLGGNLTVICSLIGTGQLPSFSGAIVFLEDVGEPPYRVDRLLQQLYLSGALAGVAGLCVGRFTATAELHEEAFESLFQELAGMVDGPVVRGLAVGHDGDNLAIPIGVRARLDSAAPRLELLEPVTQ